MTLILILLLTVFATNPIPAHAQSAEAPVWHGFISQGFLKTTENNFLADSQGGTFDFTEIGLNATQSLGDNIDVGAQLFSRKLGPNENFDVKFDWFYADYQSSNWLKFKVGRIKIPFGLYNEQSDIDSARVPILLPQSIYPAQSRNYLLAQNGVQIYGFGDLGSAGSLDYHVYAGSINVDLPPITSTTTVITQINIPYLVGTRLLWETPVDGLRTAITVQRLTGDFNVFVAGTPLTAHLPAIQWIASVEYAFRRLTLATEYAREYVKLNSDSSLLPSAAQTSEQFYVMANYQLTDRFAPGLYYSMYAPDILNRGAHERRLGDLAIYFRYDLNRRWLLKLEGHMMEGTAGLDTALNGGQPLSSLADEWQAVLLKTTVNF